VTPPLWCSLFLIKTGMLPQMRSYMINSTLEIEIASILFECQIVTIGYFWKFNVNKTKQRKSAYLSPTIFEFRGRTKIRIWKRKNRYSHRGLHTTDNNIKHARGVWHFFVSKFDCNILRYSNMNLCDGQRNQGVYIKNQELWTKNYQDYAHSHLVCVVCKERTQPSSLHSTKFVAVIVQRQWRIDHKGCLMEFLVFINILDKNVFQNPLIFKQSISFSPEQSTLV
jgi:hypothetical protein